MADVEMVGRLVEEEHGSAPAPAPGRYGRAGARRPRACARACGDAGRHADPRQRGLDGRARRLRPRGERVEMRRAAERDDVADGQAGSSVVGLLLDEGEAPGDGASGDLAHRRAVEHHHAAAGTGACRQSRRSSVDLPEPFGPTRPRMLAGGDGERHAVDDDARPRGVRGRACVAATAHARPPGADEDEGEGRRPEQRGDDADRQDLLRMMIRARGCRRATRKTAPRTTEAGSRRPWRGPTRKRAACGMTRPTKPIEPTS